MFKTQEVGALTHFSNLPNNWQIVLCCCVCMGLSSFSVVSDFTVAGPRVDVVMMVVKINE